MDIFHIGTPVEWGLTYSKTCFNIPDKASLHARCPFITCALIIMWKMGHHSEKCPLIDDGLSQLTLNLTQGTLYSVFVLRIFGRGRAILE